MPAGTCRCSPALRVSWRPRRAERPRRSAPEPARAALGQHHEVHSPVEEGLSNELAQLATHVVQGHRRLRWVQLAPADLENATVGLPRGTRAAPRDSPAQAVRTARGRTGTRRTVGPVFGRRCACTGPRPVARRRQDDVQLSSGWSRGTTRRRRQLVSGASKSILGRQGRAPRNPVPETAGAQPETTQHGARLAQQRGDVRHLRARRGGIDGQGVALCDQIDTMWAPAPCDAMGWAAGPA